MKKAYVLAGFAFGDEGKGSMVDYLCRSKNIPLVVRYNGGPQCNHNVVESGESGRHHGFAQFGSGTFAGAYTHLSRFTLVEPFALVNEANALQAKGIRNALSMVSIDSEAPVITPYHWYINQLREVLRGDARHGSCGMGIGECRADMETGLALRVGDLGNAAPILKQIKKKKREEFANNIFLEPAARTIYLRFLQEDVDTLAAFYKKFWLDAYIVSPDFLDEYKEDIIFEGGQGTLLDEVYGFAPYNTYSNITYDNANILISHFKEPRELEYVGVFRMFFTRHGAGPFPTERNYPVNYRDRFNAMGLWQGKFRIGCFDFILASYAFSIMERSALQTPVIALTHRDMVQMQSVLACDFYNAAKPNFADTTAMFGYTPHIFYPDSFLTTLECVLGTKVKYTSFGPTATDKIELQF